MGGRREREYFLHKDKDLSTSREREAETETKDLSGPGLGLLGFPRPKTCPDFQAQAAAFLVSLFVFRFVPSVFQKTLVTKG